MPSFQLPKGAYRLRANGDEILSTKAASLFTTQLLGLGNIAAKAKAIDALVAFFDLEGFTRFCAQVDPKLTVPAFLSDFYTWLIGCLKAEAIDKKTRDGFVVYHRLPFFMKFTGDGLMVMWETAEMEAIDQNNVVVSLEGICCDYEAKQLPILKRHYVMPPPKLRCGIAIGTVYSIGNGNDYSGSAINSASRLQKLPGVGFAISHRGLDISHADITFRRAMILKRIVLRGIGDEELVYIRRSEFRRLKGTDKGFYKPV